LMVWHKTQADYFALFFADAAKKEQDDFKALNGSPDRKTFPESVPRSTDQ
jgi:hypothetical protein